MEDYCKWLKIFLPALILIFVIWPDLIFSATVSWWIVIVSATLLLVHQFTCKKCCEGGCGSNSETDIKEKPKRRKK